MITVLKNFARNSLGFFFFYLAFISLMIHESLDSRETGRPIVTHLFDFNALLTPLHKASYRTRTGYIWLLSASSYPLSYALYLVITEKQKSYYWETRKLELRDTVLLINWKENWVKQKWTFKTLVGLRKKLLIKRPLKRR